MASAVKPFESEGVVERTEVNMFTSTLGMNQDGMDRNEHEE